MRRTRIISVVLFVFGLATLAGCANTDTTDPTDKTRDGETQTSGIALTSDTLADTDVARMQFSIQGVNCQTGEETGFSDQQTKDLSDMMLPGGISKFEEQLGSDSQHLFADAFFLVGAGCYDVRTQPLNGQGNPSGDCAPATRNRVSVEDGQTTEILLINQCKGAAKGGLDAISAINHAPELENLEFQKFLSACPAEGQQTDDARRVCATVTDPDGNGIEFQWTPLETGEVVGDIVSTSRTRLNANRVQGCAQLAINQKGSYQFRVRAFDLAADGTRMEEVLSQQEGETITSRDSLRFPIYSSVDCPAEQEVQGRSVTMLMALSQTQGGDVPWLIQNAVVWASPEDPRESRILFIQDDTAERFAEADRRVVLRNLREEGIHFNVDAITEPEDGVTADQLEGYDVVWFQNPTDTMDDAQSFDALIDFQSRDGGLILQGDDIAHATFEDEERSMQRITHLEFVNNGETACGDTISPETGNVYQGAYTDEPLPVLEALRGRMFEYAYDIDHTRPTLTGEIILANASYSSGDCSFQGPVVSAIDPEAGQEEGGQ